jgi:hypothetical protein
MVNKGFKMSVVQKKKYFFTYTNLYAVSGTLEKKLPETRFSMMQKLASI